MKDYLERKANEYIERVVKESRYEYSLFPEEDHSLTPFPWRWKGYEKPLKVDSLVCKSPAVVEWAKKRLSLPYDTLSWLERERMFPLIRIDTVNGKTVLCSVNFSYEYGSHSIYSYVKDHLEKNISRVRKKCDWWRKGDFTYISGYWRVDDKYVFIMGNAVDFLFERHRNRKMGSPLPPHRTVNDIQSESGGYENTDGTYWIYNEEILTQYYFDEIYKRQKGFDTEPQYLDFFLTLNRFYFDLLLKSFDYYKL